MLFRQKRTFVLHFYAQNVLSIINKLPIARHEANNLRNYKYRLLVVRQLQGFALYTDFGLAARDAN